MLNPCVIMGIVVENDTLNSVKLKLATSVTWMLELLSDGAPTELRRDYTFIRKYHLLMGVV